MAATHDRPNSERGCRPRTNPRETFLARCATSVRSQACSSATRADPSAQETRASRFAGPLSPWHPLPSRAERVATTTSGFAGSTSLISPTDPPTDSSQRAPETPFGGTIAPTRFPFVSRCSCGAKSPPDAAVSTCPLNHQRDVGTISPFRRSPVKGHGLARRVTAPRECTVGSNAPDRSRTAQGDDLF